MTVIAGAISRNGKKLPEWLHKALVSNLSRHTGDVAEYFGGDHWLLAKVDVGALRSKGSFNVSDGPVFVMAGEPLLSGAAGNHQSRETECHALYADLCSGQHGTLRASTGTFCGAHYSPQEHRLTLVTDKLGLRPIYYLVMPEFAAFTSALRVFETAGLGVSRINLHGLYETCAFGFPLGDRTCYEVIRTIGPAELIHITTDSETHSRYFQWDLLEDTSDDEQALIRRLIAKFDDSIRRRLRGDKVVHSFLSGGLDSRAIVAALRKNGVAVYTFNFAPASTQDRVFGALAAKALGTTHHQVDVPLSESTNFYRKEHLRHCMEVAAGSAPRPERPSCIWSGDGGSVGLGHVYLDPATVDAFDKGDLEAGIRSYLRYNRLRGASNSAMRREFRERTRDWHTDGVREQLFSLQRKPDGRALHLFLMLNDQRRHLTKHFENIDIERFEFLLPFFDADFLKTIIRGPIRPFLRHELYIKWLQALSPAAASVPWQAYPNHEPCPIPFEGELRYQWGDYYGKAEERRLFRRQSKEALRGLIRGPFPNHLINRYRLSAAILFSLLGSTSYGHIVRVGDTFTHYWQKSQCEYPRGTPR